MISSIVSQVQLWLFKITNPQMLYAAVDTNMGIVMDQIIEIFTTIGKWVGAALMLFGCYQLIMAFKRDSEPDGFVNAVKWIAIGAVMAFALSGILDAFRDLVV